MAGPLTPTGSPSATPTGVRPPPTTLAPTTLARWRLGLDGLAREANEAMAVLVGRRPEELVGVSARAAGASAELADALSAALVAAAGGQPAGEVAGPWLRGPSTLHLRLAWTVERGPDGAPSGLDLTCLDQTRLVAAERLLEDLPAAHSGATGRSGLPRLLARRRDRLDEFFSAMAARRTELAVVLDDVGLITYVSPSSDDLLGREYAEVVGTRGWSHVHPADQDRLRHSAGEVGAGGGAIARFRLRHRDGDWRWFEGAVTNLFDTPVGGLVLNLTDVTSRVRAEHALARSEARHRAIAESSGEGLWVASLDGRTRYANDRLRHILGVRAGRLDDDFLRGLLAELPVQALRRAVATAGPAGPVRWETGYDHPDGARRTLGVALTRLPDDEPEDGPAVLVLISDVTQARRMEADLRRAALRDKLTGLPNRALLLDRLDGAMARSPASVAAVVVDLDEFKAVNDACGHAVGDLLLVAVAERLRLTVQPADTVARVGGDEFVVVSENVDEGRARRLVADLLTALRAPFRVEGHTINLTASCGVALSPAGSSEYLLRHADAAMHAAKAAGPGSVRVSDPELTGEVERAFELGTELWRALGHDGLTMHYQPVVDLVTGEVLGVEALARWEHDTLGMVPPDRFVPVAEQAGLGPELDRWALRTAIREVRAMRDRGVVARDAYVAVNLTRRTLTADWLESFLATCVRTCGLAPRDVVLEVTEGSVMTDPARAAQVLGRLRDRGYRIALDDFGTGHSSLASLRTLPISVLKMDRSFVSDLRDDDQALAIARMVVDLARAVGMGVVAEGVESPAHARLLAAMGCAAGQGWLWSRALSPAEAARTGALRRSYDRRRTSA